MRFAQGLLTGKCSSGWAIFLFLEQSVCVPVGHIFFYQKRLLGQPPPLYRPRRAASFWKQTLGWLPDFQFSSSGLYCSLLNSVIGLRKYTVQKIFNFLFRKGSGNYHVTEIYRTPLQGQKLYQWGKWRKLL